MLVYQCNSCNEVSGTRIDPPMLPPGWHLLRITGGEIGTRAGSFSTGPSTLDFALCPTCFAKPITFGNITLHATDTP